MNQTAVNTILPNQHEKAEWSRLASWAYANGHNEVGHCFSMAAALATGMEISLTRFDYLQEQYRGWLVFGTVPVMCQHEDFTENQDGDCTCRRCGLTS